MAPLIMGSDPEWLPSTIVQSSAALVAIVGGLLVARLLGMRSERASLMSRQAELTDQLDAERLRQADLIAQRTEWGFRDFVDSAAWLYYEYGVTDPEELAERVASGATPEERRGFADTFVRWIEDNEPALRRLLEEHPEMTSVEDLRDKGFEVSPVFESTAEAALSALKPRDRGPLGVWIPPIPIVDNVQRSADLSRRNALDRDLESAERQLAWLQRALDRVQQQLATMSPQGVRGTLVALGVIIAAGVAFPIVIMAMRWPELTAPWRVSMVTAFLLSVVLLAGYLHRLSRSITTGMAPSHVDPE